MATDHNFKIKKGLHVLGTEGIYLTDTNTRIAEGSGNAVRIITSTGHIDIGSMNSGWVHMQANKNIYILPSSYVSIDGNLQPYTDSARTLGANGTRWSHTYTDNVTVTDNIALGGTISGGTTITSSGNITTSGGSFVGTSGHVQTAGAYFSGDIRVLNNAGDGWNVFADRTNGKYVLSAITTVNVDSGYLVGGTAVINSSRGLTNITSGNIAGNLTIDYTGNGTNDAGIAVFNDSSDWGIKIDKDGSATYGLMISADGNYPFYVTNAAGTEIFRIISGGATTQLGNSTIGNSSTAARYRAHYSDGAYMDLEGYGLVMNRGASYIRPSSDGDKTLYIGGADASLDWSSIHFRSSNGLYMTGTQFLDTNRNLVNIGTINTGQGATEVHLMNQNVRSSDSPTFQNLTVQGNLNLTGDINSYNVTDLDVVDKTITLGVGGTASANDGGGIVVDGANAKLTWNNTGYWQMNKKLAFNDTATTTNQGLGLFWTGFDKEGTSDSTDNAKIIHTTNIGGHSGSVLVIESQNDANDGIAFITNASSRLKHNSNNIFTDAYHPNADTLTTARTIAGTSFDGSANIDISYDNLTNKPSNISNSDTVDGLHAASFIRSDAGDTASGTYIFSRTTTTPAIDISGHAGAGAYNYFMRAGNDGGNKAVHFVNGSTRSADHGANAYVIRNDGGIFVLGKTDYATKIYGSGDLTYNNNEVWHAGNDGTGSGLDADKLDGQQPSQSGGANRIAQFASNGYLTVGNWIYSANGTGIYWPGGLHVYESSGNLHINTSGSKYTSVAQGTLWGSSNDGSGSGLDADLLDGVQGSGFLRSDTGDAINADYSIGDRTGNNWNLNASNFSQLLYGNVTGVGGNVSTVFDPLVYKDTTVWGYNGSSWTNLGNADGVLDGNYAHQFGGLTLSRSYSEFVIDFGTSLGYTFFGSIMISHSTNGNSMAVYVETKESVTNAYESGWTTETSQTGIGSWPGGTILRKVFGVGASYRNNLRIRIVPTWSHASNTITIGMIAGTAHYGSASKAFWTNHDKDLYIGSTNIWANADSSASKVWHQGNDGTGSGLDADLLDGQEGTYYRTATNINAGTLNNARLPTAITIDHLNLGGATGDNGEDVKLGGIRGRFTGEHIQLYRKVGIGSPNGWDSDNSNTPDFGVATYGGANLAYNQGTVTVTTGSIGTGTTNRGLIMDGNYTNGQYRHRWRKQDNGGGVPLYLDYSEGSANSYTAIARFGPYTNNSERFEVYGKAKVDDLHIQSGSGGTNTQGLLFTLNDNADAQAYIKKTAYYMHYNAHYNEGHRFTVNGTDDMLRMHGSNNGTRPDSVDILAGNGLYMNNTQVMTQGRQLVNVSGNISQFTNNSGYLTSSSGTAANSQLLDNLDSTKFTYYRGVPTGDWDTIFTTGTGKTQTSGLYQVNNMTSGSYSNYPGTIMGITPYTYGGVFAWNLANHTFKMYSTHVGNLYYQSGWNNDEYSGWRMILDSGNYNSAGIWGSANDGAGSGLDADTVDGIQGASFLRADAQDNGAQSAANYLNLQYLYNKKLLIGNGTTNFSDNYNDSPWYGIGRTNVDGWYSGQDKAQMAFYWGLVLRSAQSRIELGPSSSGPIQFGDGGTTVFGKINSTGIYQGTSNLVWHAGNDGAGSGLDADTLDSRDTSDTGGANKVMITNSSGNTSLGSGRLVTGGLYGTGHSSSILPIWQYNAGNPGYGIGYYESSPDVLRLDVSSNLMSGTADLEIRPNDVRVNGNTVWHVGNDGAGSGLDADTVDSLEVHTGRNNEANKIVRTNVHGYIDTGYINTINNDMTTTLATKVYVSNDNYIRHHDMNSFRSLMNVSANGNYNGREQSTSDTNYWIGSMGWGTTDLNNVLHFGSGFWDSWSTPGNRPSTYTTHWTGINMMHYSASNTYHHGGQMAMGAGNPAHTYLRGWWANGGSGYGWQKIWTDGNDGDGSGLDAGLLSGMGAKSGSGASGANQIMRSHSNGYLYMQNWIDVGTAGLFSTTTNGAHFRPNGTTSYGTWASSGSKGGYDGLVFDHGGDVAVMFDGSGNGGFFDEGNRWFNYHHVGNACTAFNASTTSSSYTIYSHGAIYSTGDIVAYSDRRIKENIITIDTALEKVNKLRGVYYNRIDDEDKEREIGFIAQEVNEVAPELVTYAEDVDQYGVKYGNTTALLVEAIKELTQQVKDLKQEVEELKNG